MPRADDLFRPTAVPDPPDAPEPVKRPRKSAVRVVDSDTPAEAAEVGKPQQPTSGREQSERTHSGRVKHDEKMTVYMTSDELLELEHARLILRRTLGSAVDRGRIVRAAVAMALADLDEYGEESALARRLQASRPQA